MKIYLIFLAIIMLIPFSYASLGTFDKGDCVNIVTVLNASNVNITNIVGPSPNSTIFITNQIMTKNGQFFNYSFCTTQQLGLYTYGYCDNVGNCYSNDFTIGKNPDGIVIVFFSIAFIIIMILIVAQLIISVGHIMRLDFDVVDLSKSLGIYFGLFALYMLEKVYMGSANMETFLVIFLSVGGFTHVLVPIIAFIISITVGSLKKGKFDIGMRRFRRTRVVNVGGFGGQHG